MTGNDQNRSTVPIVIAGVVVLVAVVAAIAVLATRGDDDTVTMPTSPADTTPVDDPAGDEPAGDEPVDERLPPEVVGEVRDVEIEGEPLPRFDPDGADDPAIGQRPPVLVGEAVDGVVHTISPDIDGPIMLVFLAHWCPACNVEVPHLVQLDDEGRLPDDLNVYGVLTAVAPDRPGFPPSEWLAGFGWPWVSVADGVDFDVEPPQWAAADAFGLSAYPYIVLVDGGVVVDRWVGELGVDALADRIATGVG